MMSEIIAMHLRPENPIRETVTVTAAVAVAFKTKMTEEKQQVITPGWTQGFSTQMWNLWSRTIPYQ
jgi:hypothetical protein